MFSKGEEDSKDELVEWRNLWGYNARNSWLSHPLYEISIGMKDIDVLHFYIHSFSFIQQKSINCVSENMQCWLHQGLLEDMQCSKNDMGIMSKDISAIYFIVRKKNE